MPGVFIAIGHRPNTDLFADQLDMDEAGYLVTGADRSTTNIEGVFAVVIAKFEFVELTETNHRPQTG